MRCLIRTGLTLSLMVGMGLHTQAEEALPRYDHVVMVSVDGLRPSFYLEESRASSAPFLHSLVRNGASAHGVKVAYPSQTYPGHATLVTGVWPDRHEVTANTKMKPPVLAARGYWYQGDMKSKVLWAEAEKQGLKVAAISWPCSGDAKGLTWNMPEFWSSAYASEKKNVEKYADEYTLSLLQKIGGDEWDDELYHPSGRDELLTQVAAELLEKKKPDLLLLHLRQIDKLQHKYGPKSRKLASGLKKVDGLLKKMYQSLVATAGDDPFLFVVVGDHGFASVKYTINPNALLLEKGYLVEQKGKIKSWKALVRNTGGSAGVYTHEDTSQKDRKKIRHLLEEQSELDDGTQLYRLIDKAEVAALSGPKDADYYLEAMTPYMFSGSTRMPFLKRSGLIKGNHGYLSTRRAMHTGLVMVGPGVKHTDVVKVNLTDVAPTLAAALGFSMDDVEGRPLLEFFKTETVPAP